jgi:hypothetical protein
VSLEAYAALCSGCAAGPMTEALRPRPLVSVEVECGAWGRVELPRSLAPDTPTDVEELCGGLP